MKIAIQKRVIGRMLSMLLIPCMMAGTFFSAAADENKPESIISYSEIMDFDKTFDSSIDCSEKLSELQNAKSFSVTCRFYQSSEDTTGSIFSYSNSQQAAVHFHIYVEGARLGYEFRYNGSKKEASYVDVLQKDAINSVAFVADENDKSFKLYANGELVHTLTFDDGAYPLLEKLRGADSVRIGATDRVGANYEYPFFGRIADVNVYTSALSDEQCKSYTSYTPAASVENNISDPFNYDAFSTHKFRIPCLTTLQNGNLLAVADVRASGLDSPDNIEIGVRILDKTTNTWSEPIIAMEFDDYERGAESKNSASYIDSAIVQLESGRILMLSDAMPSDTGGGTGTGYNGMVTIGGKHYYALTKGDATLTVGYDYYLYPNPDSEHDYDKYLIKNVADSSNTEYTANGKMCLYKNGEALYVKQQPNNEVDVPMSIFYSRSELQLYHTAYWALSYSDDNGYTWSDPVLVGSEFRGFDENFYNKSPGLGYQVKSGEYKGRIIFPIYTGYDFFDLSVAMFYSDDGGVTWSLGEKITMNKGKYKDENGNVLSLDPGYGCEAQLIELPDGTLRVFSRTSSKYIGYADSLDGGVTFEPLRNDFGLEYCSDCMVSVINYSQKIDGKDVVIISYPLTKGRYDGRIKIGLITENEGFDAPAYGRYTIEWKYTYDINKGVFWYSCLAELDNYGLAFLYEPGTSIIYREVNIKNIMLQSDYKYLLADISDDVSTLKVSLTVDTKIYPEFSDLENANLIAKSENSDVMLKCTGISDDGRTVIFEATLEDFKYGYSYTVIYSPENDLFTLNGALSASLIGPVTVKYSIEETTTEDVSNVTEEGSEATTSELVDVSEETTDKVTEQTSEDAIGEHSSTDVEKTTDDEGAGARSGCKGSIGAGAAALIGGAAVAVATLKKKKED